MASTGLRRDLAIGAVAAWATVASYLALVVTAALDWPVVFALLLTAAVALDVYVELKDRRVRAILATIPFGISVRSLVQTVAVALLVERQFPKWGVATLAIVVLLLAALSVTRIAYQWLISLVHRLSDRPLLTRNIDLPGARGRDPLPPLLERAGTTWLVFGGQVATLVCAWGVVLGALWPFAVAAVLYVLVGLAGCVVLLLITLRTFRERPARAYEQAVLARVRKLDPEVVLYFSGSRQSVYQVNMWLPVLAALPQRCLVLLRERYLMDKLAPTSVPVVCMTSGISVMQAGLDAKVALYPANTGKNIHLLREPNMCHVFIGHGDSDKVSSINPFARVYDEVWVAGRAGRERYARAQVGVRDEAVVEVGRPQLQSIQRVADGRPPADPLTVLYAPTWEGWTDETFASSITDMGPQLVRALLDADPPIRVIYKPHPFTGNRDRNAAKSMADIVGMLAAANNARRPAAAPDRELLALEARLADPSLSPAEKDELEAEWSTLFWARPGTDRHLCITGNRPTLFDCFNHADLLVGDVSSVVSDFLASGKPYICANPRGLPAEEFQAENPSSRAAYLLGPDCADLPSILGHVRNGDPLASARAELREYLLGSDEPSSLDRWSAALGALAARARSRDRVPTELDSDSLGDEVPVQALRGPDTGRFVDLTADPFADVVTREDT